MMLCTCVNGFMSRVDILWCLLQMRWVLEKTVQMLAVIVSSVCSRREAEIALNRATMEQNNAELHVLGSEARRLRLEAAEEARRRQEGGPDSGPSQSAMKKARKIVWQVSTCC